MHAVPEIERRLESAQTQAARQVTAVSVAACRVAVQNLPRQILPARIHLLIKDHPVTSPNHKPEITHTQPHTKKGKISQTESRTVSSLTALYSWSAQL